MSDVEITVRPNGPLVVKGPVTVVDVDGNEYTTENPVVKLCRCGASSNKPFCDGEHSRIGFAAAEAAVPESREGS